MGANLEEPETRGRLALVQSIKTPLAFFVLSALIAEVLLGTLLVSSEGSDRTIAIVGMLVLLVGTSVAVFWLAYHRPEGLAGKGSAEQSLEVLSFDRVMAEMASTLDRLERDDYHLARSFRDRGDLQRLLDGLYSGLLYATGAVPSGRIEAIYYGNLMDWDGSGGALRVRYFKGPYNEEIITRAFPLKGPKQGVASAAINTGSIQFVNSMEAELKEKGEARLRAMVSIPVPAEHGHTLEPNRIHVINIDSVVGGEFPSHGSGAYESFCKRAKEVAGHVRRVNLLQRRMAPAHAPVEGSVP